MNNYILVPTDFSENALYAAKYACDLAIKKHWNISLYHCYTVTSSNFNTADLDEKFENEEIFKADLLIAELRDQLLLEFPTLTIETKCERGLLHEALPLQIKEGKHALIVMGTTGKTKSKSIVWGTNTSQISAVSSVPVVAIPNNHVDLKLNRVAILTNFKAEELEALKSFLAIADRIEHLEIIHVLKEERELEQTEEKLASWTFIISELDNIDQVSSKLMHTIEHDKNLDTIPEVINDFIVKENFDMIIVTKSRKSFFERLLRKSVSKELTLHLMRPTFFDNN